MDSHNHEVSKSAYQSYTHVKSKQLKECSPAKKLLCGRWTIGDSRNKKYQAFELLVESWEEIKLNEFINKFKWTRNKASPESV